MSAEHPEPGQDATFNGAKELRALTTDIPEASVTPIDQGPTLTNPEAPLDPTAENFKLKSLVAVKRTDGRIEDDWHVEGYSDDGRVVVTKSINEARQDGTMEPAILEKKVSPVELGNWQPRIPNDTRVTIQTESGPTVWTTGNLTRGGSIYLYEDRPDLKPSDNKRIKRMSPVEVQNLLREEEVRANATSSAPGRFARLFSRRS